MGDLIIKPEAGGSIKLQNNAGTNALVSDNSGNITLAGTSTLTNAIITAGTFPAGHALQTVSDFQPGVMSSTLGASPGTATGLSVSLTPAKATNKILITVNCGTTVQNQGGTGCLNLWSSLTSGIIGNGTSTGTRLGVMARFGASWNGDSNHGFGTSFSYMDYPTTWVSGTITYKLYMWNQGGTTYIGRSANDENTSDSYGSRTSSTMTATEIQV